MGQLQAGTYFGEMALLYDEVRKATVVATQVANICTYRLVPYDIYDSKVPLSLYLSISLSLYLSISRSMIVALLAFFHFFRSNPAYIV